MALAATLSIRIGGRQTTTERFTTGRTRWRPTAIFAAMGTMGAASVRPAMRPFAVGGNPELAGAKDVATVRAACSGPFARSGRAWRSGRWLRAKTSLRRRSSPSLWRGTATREGTPGPVAPGPSRSTSVGRCRRARRISLPAHGGARTYVHGRDAPERRPMPDRRTSGVAATAVLGVVRRGNLSGGGGPRLDAPLVRRARWTDRTGGMAAKGARDGRHRRACLDQGRGEPGGALKAPAALRSGRLRVVRRPSRPCSPPSSDPCGCTRSSMRGRGAPWRPSERPPSRPRSRRRARSPSRRRWPLSVGRCGALLGGRVPCTWDEACDPGGAVDGGRPERGREGFAPW